jgi:hypothetical protein
MNKTMMHVLLGIVFIGASIAAWFAPAPEANSVVSSERRNREGVYVAAPGARPESEISASGRPRATTSAAVDVLDIHRRVQAENEDSEDVHLWSSTRDSVSSFCVTRPKQFAWPSELSLFRI